MARERSDGKGVGMEVDWLVMADDFGGELHVLPTWNTETASVSGGNVAKSHVTPACLLDNNACKAMRKIRHLLRLVTNNLFLVHTCTKANQSFY